MVAEAINDCWKRIGVQGDHSCEQLRERAHCHRCQVYADAAQRIMRRNVPEGYMRDWAAMFSRPEQTGKTVDASALIFRIGDEWLALPSILCVAIAEKTAIHKLPHRSGKGLAGIVNVKGKLYPCASLAELFGIQASEAPGEAGRRIYPRMMVVQFPQQTFALPVSEIHGIHGHAAADLQTLPANANKGVDRYLSGILAVAGLTVGCLDPELVGNSLTRLLR